MDRRGLLFGIGAQDEVNDLFGISIGTTNKTISEGEILELEDYIDGNAWAGATFSNRPKFGRKCSNFLNK